MQELGFIIANGRLSDDCGIGEVTYYSTQGVSTVDCLLLHNSDLSSIHNFQILPSNEFSDHAPLYFSFLQKDYIQKSNESINVSQNKIFWDSEKEPLYRQYVTQSLLSLDSIKNTNCTINEKV